MLIASTGLRLEIQCLKKKTLALIAQQSTGYWDIYLQVIVRIVKLITIYENQGEGPFQSKSEKLGTKKSFMFIFEKTKQNLEIKRIEYLESRFIISYFWVTQKGGGTVTNAVSNTSTIFARTWI